MSHAISFSLFSDIELEENGAGLSISKSSSVSSIHHCMFINCYSHQSGAGIYIDHCSVQIRFCCFNQCKSKGAIAICNIGSDELIEFFSYQLTLVQQFQNQKIQKEQQFIFMKQSQHFLIIILQIIKLIT